MCKCNWTVDKWRWDNICRDVDVWHGYRSEADLKVECKSSVFCPLLHSSLYNSSFNFTNFSNLHSMRKTTRNGRNQLVCQFWFRTYSCRCSFDSISTTRYLVVHGLVKTLAFWLLVRRKLRSNSNWGDHCFLNPFKECIHVWWDSLSSPRWL